LSVHPFAFGRYYMRSYNCTCRSSLLSVQAPSQGRWFLVLHGFTHPTISHQPLCNCYADISTSTDLSLNTRPYLIQYLSSLSSLETLLSMPGCIFASAAVRSLPFQLVVSCELQYTPTPCSPHSMRERWSWGVGTPRLIIRRSPWERFQIKGVWVEPLGSCLLSILPLPWFYAAWTKYIQSGKGIRSRLDEI